MVALSAPALLTDLRLAVLRSAGRYGCALERLDFEEQYALALDDQARIALCRRWLTLYRPIPGERQGNESSRKTRQRRTR